MDFRTREKEILDGVLGVGIYDRRIRPGGSNSTGEDTVRGDRRDTLVLHYRVKQAGAFLVCRDAREFFYYSISRKTCAFLGHIFRDSLSARSPQVPSFPLAKPKGQQTHTGVL